MMLPTRLFCRVVMRHCIAARIFTLNQMRIKSYSKQLIAVRAMGTTEISSTKPNEATTRSFPLNDQLDAREVTSDQPDIMNDTKTRDIPPMRNAKSIMTSLDNSFTRFVDTCQNTERVVESNFVRNFDNLTRGITRLEESGQLNDSIRSNLAVMCAILLRCCGELMNETSEKHRELLAGNLWHFMKEKNIPIDISHYNALFRVLNENNTNYDPQKMLDEIEQNKCFPDKITYQRLIHQYCLQGDVINATKLLETMKNKSYELNEGIFASLIVGYSKQDSPPAVTELFDLMKSSGVEPGSKSYTAAIVSQIHAIGKEPTSNNELEKIYDQLKQEDVQFNSTDAIKLKTELSVVKGNDIVEKINEYVTENGNLGQHNDQSKLISSLLKIGEFEEASKTYWSLKPSSTALKYSNLGRFYITLLAQHTLTPIEFVISECTKLRDTGYNASAFIHLLYVAASKKNPALVRATIDKLKEEGTPKCQFYWPLLASSTDLESVVKILKEDLDPKMNQDDLLDTFVMWVWPKCFGDIGKLFELNQRELHYDNQILLASLVQYSAQSDKITDTIKFISAAPLELVSSSNALVQETNGDDEESTNSNRSKNNRRGDIRGRLIGRLLQAVARESKDSDLVKKALSLCNLVPEQLNTGTLKALVEVHILNEKYDAAISEFLQIAQQHRVTPCKSDLIKHCLENKDPDNLQKIMDVSNDIHGEANSLFDLAIACLECGKHKQAQKIFASPGFRVNPVRVYRQARMIANNLDISTLEKYIHLTRDLPEIDAETVYHILINAYERTSNAHRILELWNRMQEEEFHPGKRSLMMIADALEKNHIEVPFRRPTMNLKD